MVLGLWSPPPRYPLPSRKARGPLYRYIDGVSEGAADGSVAPKTIETRKGPLVPYAGDTEKLTLAALEKSFESARDRRVDGAVENKLQSAAPLDVADLLPHLRARAATVTASAKAVLGTRGRQEAEAMRRIIEDQRKRILVKKGEVERN